VYRVQIPVTNCGLDCEATYAELQRAGAMRVWLATGLRGIEEEQLLQRELEDFRRNRLYFEDRGVEVGVWVSGLGHGGALAHDAPGMKRADRYERIVGLDGSSCEDSMCPTGEAFVQDYLSWFERIARTGAKMIMIDDDFRLSLRPCGNGCCCDRHMAEYCSRVGEKVTRGQLKELVFSGKPGKYRDAWLEMSRDSLIGLAQKIRERVDRVNPEARLGVCAVMSTWDVDGVNAMELTCALAGRTQPFLRTIGAPYWAANNPKKNRLGYVIGVNRMQKYWCENQGIELFSEGDAYPRPRYCTPASFLEMYDMALRADGGWDGILKYMIDYTSSVGYERGYIDRMVRNKPAYEWIEKHLSGGRAEGADVICRMDRLRKAVLPDGMTVEEINDAYFTPSALRMASDASIPVAFGTGGVHMAFGENGRYLSDDQLNDGAVLDLPAARLLMERGVDVGIDALGPESMLAGREEFLMQNERVAVGQLRRYRKPTLKTGAEVLSVIGEEITAFRYENAKGQRFLVYSFDMDASWDALGACRSYCRQRQLIEGLEWAGRRKLPAVCPGQPDLYVICKRTEEGLAVGLWNLSCDYIADAHIRLGAAYSACEMFGAAGKMESDSVRLEGDLAPYAFAGILLKT